MATTKKTTKSPTKKAPSKKTTEKEVGKGRKYGGAKTKTQKYVEGLGKGKSKKKAALDAGYSKSTAENARHKIEKTKLFLNEIERLKEDLNNQNDGSYVANISVRLTKLLNKNETAFYKDDEGVMHEFKGSEPDPTAVSQAVDKIARLTGLYSPQQISLVKDDASNLSAEELKRRIEENHKKLASLNE